jgi:hypothetical protein
MSDDNAEQTSQQATTSQQTTTSEQATTMPKAGFLSRVLWLGPRVTQARATTFSPSQPGHLWYDIARQIGDDVVKIGETGKGSWAVLLLDCTAVEMLVRAHLTRAGLSAGSAPLTQDDFANAQKLPSVEAAWGKLPVAHTSILAAMLGPDRDATIERLSGEEREAFAESVHDLVMRLAEPLEFEANRLGRALFARWTRVLVTVLILGGALAWTGNKITTKFGKPNLALHRPVTVSSQFPGQGTDHTLLVDGDHDNLGFHTNIDPQSWAMIDLGAVKKFNKIVVYNRADGFEERAVPIKIEVSSDNATWKQIAERKETFDKWTVKNLHAEGRYVRLKNTPPNYFHLAEVEVY